MARENQWLAEGMEQVNAGAIAKRPTGKTKGVGVLGTMTVKGAETSSWRI